MELHEKQQQLTNHSIDRAKRGIWKLIRLEAAGRIEPGFTLHLLRQFIEYIEGGQH